MLADWLIAQVGVSAPMIAPPGVEITARIYGSRRLLFVLNHTQNEQSLALDRPYRNLLSGALPLHGSVQLAAHSVLILEEAD
jgi:beta-galactosidase GanA